MTEVPVLESARLVLRPLSVEDAAALHPLYVDVEAMRWWSHPPHVAIEETRAKLAKNVASTDWARLGDHAAWRRYADRHARRA